MGLRQRRCVVGPAEQELVGAIPAPLAVRMDHSGPGNVPWPLHHILLHYEYMQKDNGGLARSPPRWWAPAPGQIQGMPSRHTEFVTCDYTIERTFEEVKKRSKKMAAAFRNEGSCLLLFYAVVRTLRLRKIRMPG